MSDDRPSNRPADERPERPELLGLEPEQIEAARLSELLTSAEDNRPLDLDPVEDPALTALLRTASVVRTSLNAPTAHGTFRSFHERSRRRVMAATPRAPRAAVSEGRGESLLQRWNGLFTSVASAAAASIATFVVTVIAVGGGSSTAPLTVQTADPGPASEPAVSAAPADTLSDPGRVNLTSLSIDDQIISYVDLLERLAALTTQGQPADTSLLRDIADTSSTVARTIETRPETVTGQSAWVAYQTTFKGQQVLDQASVASENEQQILDNAQVAAEGAFITAARYLGTPAQAPTADEAAAALSSVAGTPRTDSTLPGPEAAE